MTYPRRQLVVPGHAGTYHCVALCVRRAWLCGVDSYTNKCFEHRKAWVESRIQHLGAIFAVGIHTYAVMSNHLHIVLHVAPSEADAWSDSEIADRWLLLYPPKPNQLSARHAELCAQAERLKVLRLRLGSLSWFMSCLNEHIARLANAEDQCTGRFWEGRFSCQALLSEHAVLAACAYVDLNPIRAGVAKRVSTSLHTGVRLRALALKQDPQAATSVMRPLAGLITANFPRISTADYIELVD